MKPKISVVWFKRDLRLTDHLPLQSAIEAGFPTLLLYIFEPSLMQHYDSAPRHWRFVWQSLNDLQKRLHKTGHHLVIAHNEVREVFLQLLHFYSIQTVYSHEEIGIRLTYDRDLALSHLLKEQQIEWKEFPSSGIKRGKKNRKGWKEDWFSIMEQEIKPIEFDQLLAFQPTEEVLSALTPNPLPTYLFEPHSNFQQGGESYAWRYLKSFMKERIQGYMRHISKPSNSRRSCSLLI